MRHEAKVTWEAIAPSYAKARARPWPAVVAWVRAHAPPGARLLDLACGGGRHAGPFAATHDVVACDFALPMLPFAGRGVPGRAVAADATDLPFRDRAFDAALYIAALHNVPGRTGRLAALAELRRVLAPGARALVTVWQRWHPERAPTFLAELPHRVMGDSATEFGDLWVDWPVGDARVPRFYHFYSRRELLEDLTAAGFEVESLAGVAVARRYPDNLFATVRRDL